MKFDSKIILLTVYIFYFAANTKIQAQQIGNITLTTDDNPFSLVVEKAKNHKQVFFVSGQLLGYKTSTSGGFRKDRIMSISDSTISFENKNGIITIRQKELVELNIPKSNAGGILIGVGGLVTLIGGLSTKPASHSTTLNSVIGNVVAEGESQAGLVLGASMIVTGLTLAILPRHAKLGKKWILAATSIIIPGNIITMTLTDGGVIKMKVTSVSNEKITGIQSSTIVSGQKAEQKRTINIKDIIACSRNAN